MLEVSRVGVAESDDEIELSLELSIGGSYGKCEKPRQVIEESLSRDNERVVENVVPGAGYTFLEASVGGEQVEGESTGSVPETVDPNKKREIQALRRLEARRKREEKMRKSTVNFRGINANYDKVGLETQQFHDRAQCRKFREDENFLDDKSGRKKETVKFTDCVSNEVARGGNFALKIDETAIQNHDNMQLMGLHPQSQCVPLKNGFLHPYGAPSLGCGGVRKEQNEMKEKYMFRPVASGSFRPYFNGTGDIVRQNSGTCFDSGHHSGISRNVHQNVVSNGSLERSSSAISDYRSTSGKGGSISDAGSHSSCLEANDRQMSITATSDALNQPEVNATMRVAKNIILSKESHSGTDDAAASSKPDSRVDASASKPVNPTSSPTKQSSEVLDNPSKNQTQNGGRLSLSQMPCVSTTGNGPNGKTITGFLYRYTKTEVSIVCICHGSSFSPAEFVEHAGGTDISNPLRHITVVTSSIG